MDTTPGLADLLIRRESGLIMIATWVLLDFAYRFLPKRVADAKLTVRLAPLYPLILCQIAVWLPDVYKDITGISERIFTGIALGVASAHVYKIFMQGVLGRDHRVNPIEAECEECLRRDEDDKTTAQGQRITKEIPPISNADVAGLNKP